MFPQVISAKGRKLFAKHTQPDKIVLPIRLGNFRILLLYGLTPVFVTLLLIRLQFGIVIGVSAADLRNDPIAENLTTLAPGDVIERDISSTTLHRYQISLPAGQYLRLSVDQKEETVISSLMDSAGATLIEANYAGKENLSVIAPRAAGDVSTYQVEIRTRLSGKKIGQLARYIIKIEEQRPATSRDEDRIKAERMVAEATRLSLQSGQAKQVLRRAVEQYQAALPLWRTPPVQRDDKLEEARTLYLLGLRQQDLGENQVALESYLQALEICQTEPDPQRECLVMSSLGTLYFTIGDTQKAVDCYNSALKLGQIHHDTTTKTGILVNLGIAYKVLGQNSKALEFYQLALADAQAAGDEELEASALTNLARLYDLNGAKASAEDSYGKVLSLWRSKGNTNGEAVTLKNLGALKESLGLRGEALEYYRKALELAQLSGDLNREAHIRGDLARVERDLGDFKAAREEIEQALKFFEIQRQQLLNPELRTSFATTNQRYYEFYIDLLAQQQNLQTTGRASEKVYSSEHLAAAFLASESARTRALADLIAESRIDLRDGISPDLLNRERNLGQQLTSKKAERVAMQRRKSAASEIEAVDQEITSLSVAYEQAQNEIRRASPRFAALMRPTPLSLAEVQHQLLGPDAVLLEYSLGEQRSYVWAVGRDKYQVAVLPARAEIEDQALKFYDLLTARSQIIKFETPKQAQQRIARADRELEKVAATLSRTLLQPVAAMLKQKQLLVVSDGVLNYIPFAALPEPATRESGARAPIANRRAPLLVNHEIINLPSATVLAELRREFPLRQTSTQDLAIVADPVFSRLDERLHLSQANSPMKTADLAVNQSTATALDSVMRSITERDAGGLTRLHYSRREAFKIAAMAPEPRRLLALDFQANRSLATEGFLSPYRYVHFATHGLLNSQSPELSGLVLSLVNDKGESQLGVLRLGDIYKLNLTADLVVLSACRTGLGKEVKGEGVIGLTRGFMHAGVPRVISSLWSVDDAATAELMARMYRELISRKQSPSAALRLAQRSLWQTKQWRSPYYWAAFTLQGEPK